MDKIRLSISYLYRVLFLRKKIVIVYTHGRVGSISILSSLREAGVPSIKVELVAEEKINSVKFARKHIFKRRKKAYIITLVRDPLEVLISYFFSKAGRGHIPAAQEALKQKDIKELKSIFLREVLESSPLNIHLNWFEDEFKKNTGVDVFLHDFNKKKKYSLIEDDTYPTLIMRSDLVNHKKEKIITNFLNLKKNQINIGDLNRKSDRSHSVLYNDFIEGFNLSENYINKLYNSPYVIHFFTHKEIEDMKQRWIENI